MRHQDSWTCNHPTRLWNFCRFLWLWSVFTARPTRASTNPADCSETSPLQLGTVDHICVQRFLEMATLMLQGCLDYMASDEFIKSSWDTNELAELVCSWVSYCKDTVVPEKVIKICPTGNPGWPKTFKCYYTQKNMHSRNSYLSKTF